MISKLFLAWCVLGVCVLNHAVGVTRAARWLRKRTIAANRAWSWTWLSIELAGFIIVLHLVEIAAWALLYGWSGAMPDFTSATYFSAVTYTTTGYGDLVLPSEWRLVGAVEALTGILMCGWSTGFFFAVVGQMMDARETH